MQEFADMVALITGAGRGIGREIGLAFCSLGTVIAANDINHINLDETVSQIQQAGGTAKAYVFDVAKRMPIEAMLAQVLDHFGRVDILVNHASVAPDESILEMDEWEFHRTLDVNLGGPFFCMQQVGRVMRRQGGGAMVNVLSTSGQLHAHKGQAAYQASKAGLLGLTRAAARELSEYNIRVNAVCSVTTEIDLFHSQGLEFGALHQWLESIPNVRLGEHPDLVSRVLFLCSESACSLTGRLITVEYG